MSEIKSRAPLVFVLAFLLLLLMPSAYASQITLQDIRIELFEDLSTNVNVTISFSDLTTTEVYYIVNARISDLKALDADGAVFCTSEQISYGTQIVCKPNTDVEGDYAINLVFDAYGLQKPEAEAYIFSYNLGIRSPTEGVKVLIVLPEGMGIVEPVDSIAPYYPASGTIGSTGRNINIDWTLTDLSLGKAYFFEVTYEKVAISISDSDNYIVYLFLAAVVIFFLISKFFSKPKVETILSVMKKDEKSVLDVIIRSGGNCIQRKIVKETDFSKARVSRIIHDLEERGIVKKIPSGRTNKIELIDTKQLKKEKRTEKK